jgi:hypothetical protein
MFEPPYFPAFHIACAHFTVFSPASSGNVNQPLGPLLSELVDVTTYR